MTEQEKEKKSGRIKDRILNDSGSKSGNAAGKSAAGAAKKTGKKKLVIKKRNAPQNKNITDHFSQESRPKPPRGPANAKGTPGKAPPPGGGAPGNNQPGGGQRSAPPPGQGSQNQNRPHSGGGPRPGGPGGQHQSRPGGGGPPRSGGQQQNRGPRDNQGGRPHPGQGGGRGPGGPPQNRSGGGARGPGGPPTGDKRPNFAGVGTPFDAAIEAARRPQGGGGQGGGGRRPPGGGGGGPGGGRGNYGPPGGRGGDGRRRNRDGDDRFFKKQQRRKQPTEKGTTVPPMIEIMESIQVGELAKKLNLRAGEVISRLMKLGEMVTINKTIDAETASMVAAEYNCEVKVVSLYNETQIQEEEDLDEAQTMRPPVVTIMGHVDHGKTKLLDTIRATNVAGGEAGAITQHIGAYQVEIPRGKITFLDTPGHEAFTAMRARGAAITDIVILVVAADDGIKEQTVEAINHAKEAKVPIIVAINKIDVEGANPERVKQELTQHALTPEDFGGETIVAEISAKQNIGIENLLELVLLQAEVLELKANPELRAVGSVVEARIDPGKGPVATVLVQKGTLREGDPYVVGIYSGRVRAMFDDFGNRITAAGPSTPLEITGIDGVPHAGDPFQSVENEKYGREIASKRQHYQQITEAAERATPSMGDLDTLMGGVDVQEKRIIIKADVQGSVEAIRDGLLKLSTDEIKVKVIHGATGAISESDVDLAKASDAMIIAFHIRPTARAQELATHHRVDINFYNVIYEVIEDIRNSMEGMLAPEIVESVTGQAEVREIFKISRFGNIAGCMVTSGKIKRNGRLRVKRGKDVLFTGDVRSLKRMKDDVNEVAEGYECGIAIEGFNEFKSGDILEGYEIQKIARKLDD